MMSSTVELALGTVQFGINYGVAGRGEMVPPNEVRQILKRAWAGGIRVLDTAPAYGDIQNRLIELISDYPFDIVSKIPALPALRGEQAVQDFVTESIQSMLTHLDGRIRTLLFHQASDLISAHGEIAWHAATAALAHASVKLGVSCYSPDEMLQITNRYPIQVAQIPGSAVDQRITSQHLNPVEMHVRSIFLQGTLLFGNSQIERHLPHLLPMMKDWRNWCDKHGLSVLEAAIAIAKGLPGVRYCIVGVQHLSQLESILDAWHSVESIHAPELACENLDMIDPRRWPMITRECV